MSDSDGGRPPVNGTGWPHSGLEGDWDVRTISVGGELVPPIEDSRLTLSVDHDRVWGSSGVNRFTGRLGDDRLFGLLATTRMAGPHELMAQEDIFLRHLSEAEDWEHAEDGISLTSQGLVIVTLTPSPSPSEGSGASRA
jgi:heat shock protein HslJ